MTVEPMNAKPDKQGKSDFLSSILGKILLGIVIISVTAFILWWGYNFLSANKAPQVVQIPIAILWGVGGVALLYTVLNWLVEQLPRNVSRVLQPLIFIGPAVLLMGWFLAVPVFRSLMTSFKDSLGQKNVGLENYIFAFTDT